MTVSASVSTASKALALALSAALLLSGCSLIAKITTSEPYDASDGVGAHVDDIVVQNFLIITTGEGDDAVLVGSVTNNGTQRTAVELSQPVEGGEQELIMVGPGETVRLGIAPGRELIVGTAETPPGSNADIKVAVRDGNSETLPVPVVDGTLPEYQRVLDNLPAG